MTTKVYQFGGTKQVLEGLDFAETEVSKQRELWDRLCEITWRRDELELEAVSNPEQIKAQLVVRLTKIAAERATHPKRIEKLIKVGVLRDDLAEFEPVAASDDLAENKAALDVLNASIDEHVSERKSLRQKARARIETPELDEQIKSLADKRRECKKLVSKHMRQWRADNKIILQALDQDHGQSVYDAKQSSGLYVHNATGVHDRFKQARSKTIKIGRRVSKSDPARDDGVLRVQFPGGRTWLELQKDSVMFRLRKSEGFYRADISADRDNHMFSCSFNIHRSLPENANVKELEIVWRNEGERRRYYLCLTVQTPDINFTHPEKTAVGVDVGWRSEKDGLLVCTTVDSRGEMERHYLPNKMIAMADQVERLRSHSADEAVKLATMWHNRMSDLPEEWAVFLKEWNPKRSASWIDQQGLHNKIRAGFVSKTLTYDDLPEYFGEWYKEYRHLVPWAQNLQRRFINARKDHYRLIARSIAVKHGAVAIKKLELAKLARTKKKAPEEGANHELEQVQRRNRQRAAIHTLVDEIKWQCKKAHAQHWLVTDTTTRKCHDCDSHPKERNELAKVWTCTSCGAVFDQDVNAAKNLLDYATGKVAETEDCAESIV